MNRNVEILITGSFTTVGDYSRCETVIDAERLVQKTVLLCTEYLNTAAEVYDQKDQDTLDRAARHIRQFFGVDND